MGKSRGRRLEKKVAKERPVDGLEDLGEQEKDDYSVSTKDSNGHNVFFGLVDPTEVDYFKQAELTLNIGAFDGDADRQGFIRSVLEEAKGKELKLMTNQICLKLMERLILGAVDYEVKYLFSVFVPYFTALSHQKYASHVLETLLVRAALVLEKELAGEVIAEDDREPLASMEDMFTSVVNQMQPEVKQMMTHNYASHVLRVMLLVLALKELPSTTKAHSTLRSKKLKIARKMIEIKDTTDFGKQYQVPGLFKGLLKSLVDASWEGEATATSQDEEAKKASTKKFRELAINKVALPVLQLLIQVEGINDRDRTVWHLIFASTEEADNDELAFVEYLLSDSVGSHFLELCVKLDTVRPKYVERLYKLYMADRVLKLAKRATTGVFVIQALLFRLRAPDVEHILDEIIPELAGLIDVENNENLDLAQRVIDALIARSNYRRQELIDQLFAKLAPNYPSAANERDDFTEDVDAELLENTLQLSKLTLGNTRDDWPTAEERRRSLFLEKLMEYDDKFVRAVWLNFMALPRERLLQMCFHGVFSHVVEALMKVDPHENKKVEILRKRYLQLFQGHIVDLACNSYGSHLVDKLWAFTVLLPMFKDRFAQEMFEQQNKVKDSQYGRIVWKNWDLEKFVRKKLDWRHLVKQQELEFKEANQRKKTNIERKLERLAKTQKPNDDGPNAKRFKR